MIKQYPTNKFSALTDNDLELILCWRNDPRVRGNMHNDRLIAWDEHLVWFSAMQKNSSKEFWVLKQNERPIGILNFSCIGEPNVEWGCYLGEPDVWPGSGILLEVAALDRAAELSCADYLDAEVLSFNKSALGLHKLFEYPFVRAENGGVRNSEVYDLLIYKYPLALWKNERTRILKKLPNSLNVLIETLEFIQTEKL